MISCNSYQDIKTPEEIEEDDYWESEYEDMVDEYDQEEAGGCSYAQYKANCRRIINQRRYGK